MKVKYRKPIDLIKLKNKINNDKDSILIIANGASALSKKYGELIDKFNTVGRINNYVTDKFNNFVGIKTDIWFNGANKRLKKRKKIPSKIIVLVPAKIQYAKEQRVINRTPSRLGIQKSQYTLVAKETMKEFEDYSNIKRLTTGLSSILWGLHNYNKVIIYGFDFFIDSQGHYYDSSINRFFVNSGIIKRGIKHNNIAERSFVQKLIKEKQVITLQEYLKV